MGVLGTHRTQKLTPAAILRESNIADLRIRGLPREVSTINGAAETLASKSSVF